VVELNPFEWGLPWYYYSIGGAILIFAPIFFFWFLSRMNSSKKEVSEREPLVKEKKWWE
tara:strand:+ start:602 stop:778 length:177 start_codon:yes stop_codon:yes gene_type:complete